MTRIETGPGWELRLGDFREVLADVEKVDHVICDPPYLGAGRSGPGMWAGAPRISDGAIMEYQGASIRLLRDLAKRSLDLARGWFVVFNDFSGTRVLHKQCLLAGAVVSEPIGWVKPAALTARRGSLYLPEKGTEFLTVARMNVARAKGRRIRGGYHSAGGMRGAAPTVPGRDGRVKTIHGVGGKPLWLMREIVRDFTERGQKICDPTAGWGTTLLAAVLEGGEAIGAEIDPDTFDKAVRRLREPRTMSLWDLQSERPACLEDGNA